MLKVPTAPTLSTSFAFSAEHQVHQWAKNILVFVPLVLGGRALDPTAWIAAFVGFAAISLTCSATYLINDLWDLENDRQHRTKRSRPLP